MLLNISAEFVSNNIILFYNQSIDNNFQACFCLLEIINYVYAFSYLKYQSNKSFIKTKVNYSRQLTNQFIFYIPPFLTRKTEN